MTDTITESVSLERGSLVLVTLTEDYVTSGYAPSAIIADTTTDRTFYATASRDYDASEGWVCLVVPTDDSRVRGMWALSVGSYGLETVLNDGKEYRGWNVQRQYVTLTPVDVDTPPDPSRPLVVGDRVKVTTDPTLTGPAAEPWRGKAGTIASVGGGSFRVEFDDGNNPSWAWSDTALVRLEDRATVELDKDKRAAMPVEEAYPVGSVWNHFESTRAVVTGYRGDRYLIVKATDLRSGVTNEDAQDWIRGALDLYGTFVGWADDQNTPQEAAGSPVTADESTGGTFTQEHVDAAVRQALEEFKERANRIAVEYAEANELCGNFERAMSDIGLMGREEWHEANDEESTYDVSFVVTVRGVEARDEESAREKARDDLYGELPSNMDDDIQHYSTYCRD